PLSVFIDIKQLSGAKISDFILICNNYIIIFKYK
ncbi:MAG: hypothetical protein JWQ14_3486, partial [Adhaeribacter sp.]|nr:hypothetical protein [Adhaeribacter sp.]